MKKQDFKKLALMGITGALTVVAQGAAAASNLPSNSVTLAGGSCSSCRAVAVRDSSAGEMDEGSLDSENQAGTQQRGTQSCSGMRSSQGMQGQGMQGTQGSCAGMRNNQGMTQPNTGMRPTQGGSCNGNKSCGGASQTQYPSGNAPQAYNPNNAKRSDMYSR